MLKVKKTLKKRIHTYIAKKTDICCEADIDRAIAINQIFEKYKKSSGAEYLNNINNDVVKFIGYYVDLNKDKDKEGMRLWNTINQHTFDNGVVTEQKVVVLLNEVPLYYLLSLLGYAAYNEGISKTWK
jgi:hypothetical protein